MQVSQMDERAICGNILYMCLEVELFLVVTYSLRVHGGEGYLWSWLIGMNGGEGYLWSCPIGVHEGEGLFVVVSYNGAWRGRVICGRVL